MPSDARSTFYNAGNDDPNQYALVVGGSGEELDLAAMNGNGVFEVHRGVQHLEPDDYGDAGGGGYWHDHVA